MNDALQEYSQASVAGEGQLKLIIMLYEGARKFLMQAREHIRRGEIEDAHNCLVKAKRITVHFLCTTNPEAGELAMNLHRLYVFLYERIALANLRKNVDEVDAALRILNKLLEGWKDLDKQTQSAAAARPQVENATVLNLQA